MATVSRWRSSRPTRLRPWLVGLEVFLIALTIFVAGVVGLPLLVWFALVFASVLVQTALFYRIGRAHDKLGR